MYVMVRKKPYESVEFGPQEQVCLIWRPLENRSITVLKD